MRIQIFYRQQIKICQLLHLQYQVADAAHRSFICITKKCKCQSIKWVCEPRMPCSPSTISDRRCDLRRAISESSFLMSSVNSIHCSPARANAVCYLAQTSPTKASAMLPAFHTSHDSLEPQMRVEWGLLGNRDPLTWKREAKGKNNFMIYLMKGFCVGHSRPAYCTFTALSNSYWIPWGNLWIDSS